MKELKMMVDSIRKDLVTLYNGLDITGEDLETMEENGEAIDLYTYFNDALDIEYRVGSDMELRSVKIMVACGGPNVYIDTGYGEIIGFWGTDKETAWIPSEICEEINSIFEEIFSCR